MKCTQYGLYGKTAFKNARTFLFFEIGWRGHEDRLHPGSVGMLGVGLSPGQTTPSNTDKRCCQEPKAPSKKFLVVRRHKYSKYGVLRNVFLPWALKQEPVAWLRINTKVWSCGQELWMHYSISICAYYLSIHKARHVCTTCTWIHTTSTECMYAYHIYFQRKCLLQADSTGRIGRFTETLSELNASSWWSTELLLWEHLCSMSMGAFCLEWRLLCRTFD
jgi:hypothetical protein